MSAFRCTCGREFKQEGWLSQHLRRFENDPNHAPIKDGPAVPLDGVPINVKVFVRLNNQELTLSQFVSFVNRLAAVRDTLKHLGLD